MGKWVQRYEIRYAHDITQKADGTFVTYESYERLQAKLEAAEKEKQEVIKYKDEIIKGLNRRLADIGGQC